MQMFRRTMLKTRLLLSGAVGLAGLVILTLVSVVAIRGQMIDDRITMVRNLTELGRQVIEREHARFLRGEIGEAEAQRAAIETLRTMRYANGEYFFVDDFDGRSVLLPIRPELEGTDASGMVDSKGQRFVLAQRDAALAGGGIVRYEFDKPNTGVVAEKLSHVRPFPPWRWFVATGIYLDDVDREVRSIIVQSLAVFLAVAVVGGLIILLIARSITGPLGRLTRVVRHLTRGDRDVEVTDTDRVDEVGDIARALALLRRTLGEYDELQAELRRSEAREQAEREAALAFQRDTVLRLEQTSRLISMGEMATGLAHELNQPLAAITNYCMGCVRRLEQGTSNHVALLLAMRKAAEQATRASRIIARLRRFLRRAEPAMEPQSLTEIVEETASIAEIEARRAGVTLVVDAPADLPAVPIDRVMIEQVVLNLLRNAVEAMVDQPPARRRLVVEVRLAESGDRLETAVVDFGPGIAEAAGDKVFEPFYTTKSEGMGVGLAICRSIVEFHGGRLWTTANPVGGAIFRFTLPLERPA